MARKRLPQHQELLTAVWTVSDVREDIERLLAHVVRLQSEAAALASAYGATQPELATLARMSRQRIGQLVDGVDVSTLDLGSIRDQIRMVEGWPQDVMAALRTIADRPDVDDVERRELLRRQTAVVYGQAEADRRHEVRSAFLATLSSSPERRAEAAERVSRAERQIHGASAAASR